MLVLSRRIGEGIHIGENIFFKVLGMKGNQVSLGFSVPPSIAIHRNELYQKKEKTNEVS